MEDGEISAEEGEVSYGSDASHKANKPRVPCPPECLVQDTFQPQRKPKKAKASKAAPGYNVVYGEQGRAEVQVHGSGAIRTLDVQGLVLWVLGDGMNPRWCFVKNKALVSKVVLVAIPGLDMELFKAKEEFLPVLHGQMGPPATVLSKNASVRSGSTLSTLFTVPFSKKRKRENEQKQQQTGKGQKGSKQTPFPPSHYAVSLEQMEANLYPLPVIDGNGDMTCPDGFVATQPAGDKTFPSMVSVDCEMCITAAGYELTRASLVDDKGQVLLDELVKPTNPITDYNTQFSGITAHALADVTTTLADIQQRLCQVVAAETLLVGHGLENDLTTLKTIHANCLDTALLYPHPKGPPFKPALRILAERHLKRIIQQGEHDSVIDAQAAMDLVQLKIARGPAFGTFSSEEQGDKLLDVLHAHQRRCTLVDRHDMLNRHVTAGASAIVAFSDDDAVQKTCKEAGNDSIHFVWTQLRALGTFLGVRSQHVKEAANAAAAAQKSAQLPNGEAHDSDNNGDTAGPQQQQQPQQHNNPVDAAQSEAAAGQPKACSPPEAVQESTQPFPSAALPHVQDPDNDKTKPPVQQTAAALAGAAANSQAAGSSAQSGGNKSPADAGQPQAKAVAKEHRHVEKSVEEEVHRRTETHEVVEPSNGKASGQQGAKATIVHQHSLTTTKKRKRIDEHEAEAVAAAPVAGDKSPLAEAPDGPQDLTDGTSQNGHTNGHQADAPNEPSASKQWQQDASNFTDEKLNIVLKGLDDAVARLLDAMPANGMLVLFTCQGDTAEYRRLQESKYRQQAGLDNLPPWTIAKEAELAKTASQVCRALCFATVKQ